MKIESILHHVSKDLPEMEIFELLLRLENLEVISSNQFDGLWAALMPVF